MRIIRILAMSLCLIALVCSAVAAEQVHLKMSTTTSTQDSGLLNILLPPFEKANNCKVDVIAVGTGQAVKLGESGDVDVVLVHARKLEDKFVADGFGVNRKDVMYNDFLILGPASDPAGIRKARSAAEAFRMIADKKALFVSRGDGSGTHIREKDVWQSAGMAPKGSWYVEAGQGMGAVIVMATELRGYTLSDRGTYNAFKGKKRTNLEILHQGDKGLLNQYGIIAVSPKKYPHVKHELAMKLIAYITGKEGQDIIANYKVGGAPIFFTYKK